MLPDSNTKLHTKPKGPNKLWKSHLQPWNVENMEIMYRSPRKADPRILQPDKILFSCQGQRKPFSAYKGFKEVNYSHRLSEDNA